MVIHIAIAIIFMVIGGILGVIITACFMVAGRANEQSEKMVANMEIEPQGVLITPEEYLKSQESNKKHTPYMAESKFAGMTDKAKK